MKLTVNEFNFNFKEFSDLVLAKEDQPDWMDTFVVEQVYLKERIWKLWLLFQCKVLNSDNYSEINELILGANHADQKSSDYCIYQLLEIIDKSQLIDYNEGMLVVSLENLLNNIWNLINYECEMLKKQINGALSN